MPEAIGPELTKYEILKPLSVGGMGQVYVAEDTSLRRKVAVKVLSPEWSQDPERFQRFQREARVLATLNHPNIVTIYSVEEENGIHFLTMELVEGETLARAIPSVGLSLDRIFEIAIPLANALAAAHEQGIVHRDLKPANVMVSRTGQVKILDFGLAKREQGGEGDGGGREPITQEGLMVGTVPYMAPEQLQGGEVDARADVFSLGVILFEMCTGRRPFDGKSWSDLASSILRDQPPSVTSFNALLPRHLGRIIRHCLEKDPKRRFQTALDLRNELEELQREVQTGELPITRSDLSAVIAPRPNVTQERAIAVAATVLVAAVIVLLVWLRTGSRGGGPRTGASEPAAPEIIVPGVEVPTEAADGGFARRPADAIARPRTGQAAPVMVRDAAAASESLRIVVLPMENLGPADQEHFAAGITEEITTRLASVRALHVISRTTARNYDRTDKTVQQIGRELGVDYLLTGSVRWSTGADGRSRVRVTPRLVRVADDSETWSDNYDRVLDDIFAVQSEIAEEVLDQLDIAILDTEQRMLATRPTENFEAYQAYHRGMDALARHEATRENLLQAEAMLTRATELDPGFALAFAELSEVHSQMYRKLADRRIADQLRRARAAADRALELDPDLAAGHRALGYYYYWGYDDYGAALQEFAIAARALPNDSKLLEGLAYIRRRQGRFTEAIDHLRRALELDPQNGRLALALGHTYTMLRRYEIADRTYDLAISLTPNEPFPYKRKALNLLFWKGAVDDARATLELMPRHKVLDSLMAWYRLEFLAGDYKAALGQLDAAPLTLLGIESMVFPRSLLRAQLRALLGDEQESQRLYRAALVVMERLVKSEGDDPRVRSALGLTYAGLGRAREAIREGRRAVSLTPVDEDSQGWVFMEQLAAIYAACGEVEAAIDLLEQLLAMPAEVSVPVLRLDPRWRTLRQHPRFLALLASEA